MQGEFHHLAEGDDNFGSYRYSAPVLILVGLGDSIGDNALYIPLVSLFLFNVKLPEHLCMLYMHVTAY